MVLIGFFAAQKCDLAHCEYYALEIHYQNARDQFSGRNQLCFASCSGQLPLDAWRSRILRHAIVTLVVSSPSPCRMERVAGQDKSSQLKDARWLKMNFTDVDLLSVYPRAKCRNEGVRSAEIWTRVG